MKKIVPLNIELSENLSPESRKIEIVERKGLGHPDTICDALAEQFSVSISRYYLERFGRILHHNVDKVLLCGGQAQAKYGGGRVIEPIEIYFAGRATLEGKGEKVPVVELLNESAVNWLRKKLHALDPLRDVRIHCMVKAGSVDLQNLFERTGADDIPLSNDTSIGVGFAPFSEVETLVSRVEAEINSAETRAKYPEIGEDIKVMGVRREDSIVLTIGCAFIGRFVRGQPEYLEKKKSLEARITNFARMNTKMNTKKRVEVVVNAADDPASGSVFLTVTGTSAESGDDGETGRGNRASGLITPYRPMTLEATAGKNPRTHVGKLYQVIAQRIAESIVREVPGVSGAECYLVSQIGRPVTEPQVADVKLRFHGTPHTERCRAGVSQVVHRELASLKTLWREILTGNVRLY